MDLIKLASELLLVVGIMLTITSIVVGFRLKNLTCSRNNCASLYVVIGLLFFFLAGYIYYLLRIADSSYILDTKDIITCLVFSLGGLFVILVLNTNHNLLVKELNDAVHIEEINAALRQKSIELEKVLDDLFAIRTGMDGDFDKEKIKKDNKKMKKRIDKLKNIIV